jgi:hypothetical protein
MSIIELIRCLFLLKFFCFILVSYAYIIEVHFTVQIWRIKHAFKEKSILYVSIRIKALTNGSGGPTGGVSGV